MHRGWQKSNPPLLIFPEFFEVSADFPRRTCFRQRFPLTNFPAWPSQSSVQPPTSLLSAAFPLDEFSCLAWPVQRPARVRRKIRFSPTNLQLHKSALPILPPLGMAAAAPMSGPTVFFVKPWAIQSVQTHRQPILPISPALPIPTLPRVQTSIVSSALPLTILTL